MTPQEVLAFDLGGTKVAAGIVNKNGKVLFEIKEPAQIFDGPQALVKQMARMGHLLITKSFETRQKKSAKQTYKIPLSRKGSITQVGLASAGPLDPVKGLLLDPTNFKTKNGPFGVFPLAKELSKALKIPVAMENDAAAALLAEHWIGKAKKNRNAMILTLGTGLGTGILIENELMRAGHHLHTEAGHIILNYDDTAAVCGCGNMGCAEAYLSGNGFAKRFTTRILEAADLQFKNKKSAQAPIFSGREIAEIARGTKHAPKHIQKHALAAFDEYSEILASAITSYVALYCPEIVVLTGSFAEASDLYLVATQNRLEKKLARRRVGIDLLPKLVTSSLHNQAGLIGAARIAYLKVRK